MDAPVRASGLVDSARALGPHAPVCWVYARAEGPGGEVTIDTRDLAFVDHRGLRTLDQEARRYHATIVLHTPLSTSKRLLELLDLGAVRVEVPV